MQVVTTPAPSITARPLVGASWYGAAVAITVAALANGLLLAPLLLELRVTGAFVLFVGLPGCFFVQAVFNGSRPGPRERWLLALGCGYVLAAILALVLYGLVRPLSTGVLVLGANGLNAGLLLAALARGAEPLPRLARPGWPLLLVLAVAAAFRLPNLGYSEFQGDEAKVVLRAAAALQGTPDVLQAHFRPPAEILLGATFAGALNAATELHGRLPFALAGLGGVLALSYLARTLFGAPAGLVAGLLLAVNGYFVAFARTLQYPSVALLLDTLAILCLFRFSRGPTAPIGYAVVGALLMAGSALTALSAVFLLPVAAVALWPRVFGPRRASPRALGAWLWPLALLAPAAVVVFVLLARSGTAGGSTIGGTLRYLGHRLGERALYFNLGDFLASANHYTSGLALLVLLAAGLLALIELAGQRSGGPAILARRTMGLVLGGVWLAAPLLTHLFVVRLPQTHWREVFPGLILLAAAALAGLYGLLAGRRLRAAALLAGGSVLAAGGHFVYVSWLQPWPEYQLSYPSYRHPLDWNPQAIPSGGSQDAVPRHGGGVYGAAHHHGWKTVAALMARGELPTDYLTNEREATAAWYLKRPQACPAAARLYIRAPNTPLARRLIEQGRGPDGFAPAARVHVAGQPMLGLSLRNRPSGQLRTHPDEGAEWFDREHTSPWAPVGELYRSESPRRC